jgi:hypothetical protein
VDSARKILGSNFTDKKSDEIKEYIPTLADLFNIPNEFEFEGKIYKITELSQARQGQFSSWLKRNARQEIENDTLTTDEQKAKYRKELNDAIAAREYEYNSELAIRCCRTPEGAAYLLWLGLQDEHPEIEEHEARAMFFKKLNVLAVEVFNKIIKFPKVSSPTSSEHPKHYWRSSAKKQTDSRKK